MSRFLLQNQGQGESKAPSPFVLHLPVHYRATKPELDMSSPNFLHRKTSIMVKHALTWVKPHLAVGTSIRIDPTIAQDWIAECNIQTSGVTLNPRYLPTLAPCQGVITFVHEWTHGYLSHKQLPESQFHGYHLIESIKKTVHTSC